MCIKIEFVLYLINALADFFGGGAGGGEGGDDDGELPPPLIRLT